MRRIVVGVDGSPASDAALAWAVAEARAWQGQVTAIHAWSPYVSYGIPAPLYLDEGTLEAAAKQILVDALARVVESPPFALDERVVRGRAADALIEAAKDADLLVVGTRHLGALGRVALGSVSNACVHHAPCPVVVVPEPT